MHKAIRYYRTLEGVEPFIETMTQVKDQRLKAQIHSRLARVTVGNYGDYKSIGDGILELRIHYGGGYRIYFSEIDNIVVLLLVCGTKKTQIRDIKLAKKYWTSFKEQLV